MNERVRAWPRHALAVAVLVPITGACDPLDEAAVRAGEAGPCDVIAPPRWVLRDKDGNRVPALVEPRCGNGAQAEAFNRCNSIDPASLSNFPCVRVIDHDGSFINLQYDLASGKLDPCQGGTFNTLNADHLPAGYINDKCEGEQYVIKNGIPVALEEFTVATELIYGLGDRWYMSGNKCLEETARWVLDPITKQCSGPIIAQAICPLRPVPDWVQDLLPNPPYTMAVEYE
jgi:hypothetical protein